MSKFNAHDESLDGFSLGIVSIEGIRPDVALSVSEQTKRKSYQKRGDAQGKGLCCGEESRFKTALDFPNRVLFWQRLQLSRRYVQEGDRCKQTNRRNLVVRGRS